MSGGLDMGSGNGKVNWKTLETHDGKATRVPKWVASLSKSGEVDIGLEEKLVEEGKWCDASAPALELLFDSFGKAKPKARASLLEFAAEVAGGWQLKGWLKRPSALPKAVGQVFVEKEDILVAALGNPDERVRAAATYLAGVAMPTEQLIESLTDLLQNDPNRSVMAGAALALGRLDSKDAHGSLVSILDNKKLGRSRMGRACRVLAALRLTTDPKKLGRGRS